jgi:hypothetical protein
MCWRGSRLRCLNFTCGERAIIAERLTGLVQPYAIVNPNHLWMPQGCLNAKEAKLNRTKGFLSDEDRNNVTNWWLAVSQNANTPNWDIAATAIIDGQEGLILVEAKAHFNELDRKGKRPPTTPNGKRNHTRIGEAITEANDSLNNIRLGWALSRDSHYQLANRFAWAWKIASLGKPVILVYLGFLNAIDMRDQERAFTNAADWEDAVSNHCREIVPDTVWEQLLLINGTAFRALIRVQ